MPRYKLINGEQIQLTAEEEALRRWTKIKK